MPTQTIVVSLFSFFLCVSVALLFSQQRNEKVYAFVYAGGKVGLASFVYSCMLVRTALSCFYTKKNGRRARAQAWLWLCHFSSAPLVIFSKRGAPWFFISFILSFIVYACHTSKRLISIYSQNVSRSPVPTLFLFLGICVCVLSGHAFLSCLHVVLFKKFHCCLRLSVQHVAVLMRAAPQVQFFFFFVLIFTPPCGASLSRYVSLVFLFYFPTSPLSLLLAFLSFFFYKLPTTYVAAVWVMGVSLSART